MNAFYLCIYLFLLKKGRFWSFHTQTPKRFADTKVVVKDMRLLLHCDRFCLDDGVILQCT